MYTNKRAFQISKGKFLLLFSLSNQAMKVLDNMGFHLKTIDNKGSSSSILQRM